MGGAIGGTVGGAVMGPLGALGGAMGSDPMGKGEIDKGFAGQSAATRRANEYLDAGRERAVNNQRPWEAAGLSALADMQGEDFRRDFTASDFQQDPGYAFRMAEGQKALERSAAAKGGLQSGGTLKALTRYSQDAASQEYGNAYNRFNADRDRRFGRLSTLAGMGQGASNNLSNLEMQHATGVGNNMMGLGNAQAGAAVAKANGQQAFTSGLMSIGGMAAGKAAGAK